MIETSTLETVRHADEYAVRGRRRMDSIGRMVMRPSDREIASQSDNIVPYNRNQPE